jgi:hypothetical protein
VANSSKKDWIFPGAAPLNVKRQLLGRDEHVQCLRNLILAKRVVLFYGVSGSGKTSLLEGKGGLIDKLHEDQKFAAIRLLHAGSIKLEDTSSDNEDKSNQRRIELHELEEQVKQLIEEPTDKNPDAPRLLILDQVEQCWMRRSELDPRGEELFQKLRDMLEEFSRLALLLVAQEEFLGPIEELREYLPGNLEFRYRLTFFPRKMAQAVVGTLLEKAEIDGLLDQVASTKERSDPDGGVNAVLEAIQPSALNDAKLEDDPLHIQMCGRLLEYCAEQEKDKVARARALQAELKYIERERNVEQRYLRRALTAAGINCGIRFARVARLRDWLLSTFVAKSGVRHRLPIKETAPNWWVRFWRGFLTVLLGSRRDKEPTPPTKRMKELHERLLDWGVLRHPKREDLSGSDETQVELAHDRLVVALRRLADIDEEARQRSWGGLLLGLICLPLLGVLGLLVKPCRTPHEQCPPTVVLDAGVCPKCPVAVCPPPTLDAGVCPKCLDAGVCHPCPPPSPPQDPNHVKHPPYKKAKIPNSPPDGKIQFRPGFCRFLRGYLIEKKQWTPSRTGEYEKTCIEAKHDYDQQFNNIPLPPQTQGTPPTGAVRKP